MHLGYEQRGWCRRAARPLGRRTPTWRSRVGWGICDYITKPRIAAAITGKTPEGETSRATTSSPTSSRSQRASRRTPSSLPSPTRSRWPSGTAWLSARRAPAVAPRRGRRGEDRRGAQRGMGGRRHPRPARRPGYVGPVLEAVRCEACASPTSSPTTTPAFSPWSVVSGPCRAGQAVRVVPLELPLLDGR